jgi:mono/diheme cytochrome c family protein
MASQQHAVGDLAGSVTDCGVAAPRSKGFVRLAVLLASGVPLAVLFASPGQAKPKVYYDRDVAPIFKAHCVSCHSGASAAAGLDLSTPQGLARGGNTGRAIVIGNPDRSLVLQRIKGLGGKPQMPIGFPALSAADIGKISDWIVAGAPFAGGGTLTHWAYIPPVRPAVPNTGSPWVRSPIDAFILARLRNEGLHPAPEASKEILLRRVSLDLTGLPPTSREMDAFLADHSKTAYEKVVDRLLASPHYGEQQARGWMDLARYADTDGYEKDLRRTAWVYRDWVVDAFNRNMPYDKFTIEQIAGDLLPGATTSDRVATGFHRNTMLNLEGGVDQAEAHFAVITDRVDTTATVWLGSTLGCARCHDHKYDPFTQRDYYRMAAFFNNTIVLPRGPKEVGEEKWYEPTIPVPSPEQETKEQSLNIEIHELERMLKAPDARVDDAYAKWKATSLAPATWSVVRPVTVNAAGGTPSVQSDGSVIVGGANTPQDTYRLELPPSATPVSAIRLEALPEDHLGGKGPGRAGNGNFVLTGFETSVDGKTVPFGEARADYIQDKFHVDRLAENAIDAGWAIGGATAKPHELVVQFAQPIPAGAKISVVLRCQSRYSQHTLGRFRLAFTGSDGPFNELLPAKIQALRASDPRTADEEAELAAYFRSQTSFLAATRARLSDARKRLTDVQGAVPTALVLQEPPASGPLTCYVRDRGEFLSKTELVTAGTPAVLPPLGDGRANRLALAKWIVNKKNPLTARVEVNRIWEELFGRGLVETSEDFGTRGSSPSHPELLDWLACEFMSNGWDMKAMHRMIVLSSTYRQSSEASEADMAKDPQNVLLARGARFRMSAETIRDNALAISGLLSLKMGGPSVFPYQPDGIWDSPYNGDRWMNSPGEDMYRRSLYTFWKRTAPYPAFISFDATSREACTVRRIRTNTPLQALTLLNDTEMMRAAAALAARMDKAGSTDKQRLVAGFRLCTGRAPTGAETTRMAQLLVKLEARYAKDPKDAKTLGGGDPNKAAWTMVGNVLLNLDETITKE